MRWLWLIGMWTMGYWGLRYTFQVARFFGKADWAEKYLGDGGTYTFWRLFSLALIVGGFCLLAYPEWFGF